MRISGIDCHVLLDPAFDAGATSSAQDDLVVEIHTDAGITGIGETDVNPWIARACIEAPGTHTMGLGLAEMLLGSDPSEIREIWDRLYEGSAMNGRRGALICALGALDMALHDLRGKTLGMPCHGVLGTACRDTITPYASLQPDVSSFDLYLQTMVEWAVTAKELGFSAAKLEITPSGPYAHKGLRASGERMGEAVAAVRNSVGDDFVLMVDVQYAFPDLDACLRAIRGWDRYNLSFIEAPLPADDLDGYARLSSKQGIPVAAGEWLTTRHEFVDLMDRGRVAVVQPDVGRVGGLTEALRVCELAGERGVQVVPHIWKTGISIAAAAHLAALTPHCPFIEFLPARLCGSALRKRLVKEELRMENGSIPLPRKPGLGVELNRGALAEFKAAAERLARSPGSPRPVAPARPESIQMDDGLAPVR